MRCAVIDVGSNTVKMTVYDAAPGVRPRVVLGETATVGLIAYNEDSRMSDVGVAKLIETIAGFGALAKSVNTEKLWCIATASLRGLENAGEVARLVGENTGVTLELISGEREAVYSFSGLCAGFAEPPRRGVMLDLGGGSTELLGFIDGLAVRTVSLPFGCLSLFREFVSGVLPTDGEYRAIKHKVAKEAECADWLSGWSDTVYLVGGTGRALGLLHSALFKTSRPSQGYAMTADEVAATVKYYRRPDKERVELLTRLVPDRLHTIIPGLCAYRKLISMIGAKSVVISTSGLREGFLSERLRAEWEKEGT